MGSIFFRLIAGFASFFVMLVGVFGGVNHFDTVQTYKNTISSVEAYENTLETAVPQTEVYNIIKNHFTSELKEGKTTKKAIVLGYDGCRADALSLCKEDGAVKYLLSTGGTANIAYCGGANYPFFNKQATSTAPGWASILTGKWADEHGVNDNGIPKSNDNLTLLTTLVEDGLAHDSSFFVSWSGHFDSENSTYYPEKQYCEKNNLNVSFVRAWDDDETYDYTLNEVRGQNCSDFIFTIFEYTDHDGHDSGFDLKNSAYAKAFDSVEEQSRKIIKAIESRKTYDTEDWLIVLTSDHGGINKGHGSFSIQERMTFIVAR